MPRVIDATNVSELHAALLKLRGGEKEVPYDSATRLMVEAIEYEVLAKGLGIRAHEVVGDLPKTPQKFGKRLRSALRE